MFRGFLLISRFKNKLEEKKKKCQKSELGRFVDTFLHHSGLPHCNSKHANCQTELNCSKCRSSERWYGRAVSTVFTPLYPPSISPPTFSIFTETQVGFLTKLLRCGKGEVGCGYAGLNHTILNHHLMVPSFYTYRVLLSPHTKQPRASLQNVRSGAMTFVHQRCSFLGPLEIPVHSCSIFLHLTTNPLQPKHCELLLKKRRAPYS